MRWIVRLLAVMALALTSASAQSPKRVALVVANASYAGYAPLPNTTVDATLVAEALRRAGFSVIDVKTNQGIAGFRTALGAFQTRAQGAEVAAVYYAGHGIEVNGRIGPRLCENAWDDFEVESRRPRPAGGSDGDLLH